MKIKCLLTICVLIISFGTRAQDVSVNKFFNFPVPGGTNPPTETNPPTDTFREPKQFSVKLSSRRFPNVSNYYSEYYDKIVNQFGLWKGIGNPLTPKQIRHRKVCYKLLKPNNDANAPFTHMQIVNRAGSPSSDLSYRPYFSSSDGLTSSWNDKFDEICQVEKIHQQGVLIQENMYDKNGDLIIQFIPTYISENEIIGHFIAPNGIMPKLREDESRTYLGIKLDSLGFFAQISFLDNDGKTVKNAAGAYTKLLTHDANGNELLSMSGDKKGVPMIDDYGNCGWRYTYDSQGKTLTASCINEKGEPMRMPTIKEGSSGVWKVVYSYDKWGNQTGLSYYDDKNNPDVNQDGIHQILYTYDSWGQITSRRSEDLHYQLVDNASGWAYYEKEYDSNGNLKSLIVKDKNGDYQHSPNNTCMTIKQYDKKDFLTKKEQFHSTNGKDLILDYKAVYSPNVDTIWEYSNNTIIIESRIGGSNAKDYNTNKTVIPIDAMGDMGRTSKADGLYYKLVFYYNSEEDWTSVHCFNEFDEPAYFLLSLFDDTLYFCTYDSQSYRHTILTNDEGDTVSFFGDGFNKKPHRSYSIEVMDSAAFKLGLKTNDLIVSFGDWYYTEASRNSQFEHLCYEMISQANTSKTMVVMRHDPKSKTSRLISIELPPGSPRQLGFIYHMSYMTLKETQRYNDVVTRSNLFSDLSSSYKRTDNHKDDNVRLFIPYKVGGFNSLFQDGFQENVIALAWEPYDGGKSYFISCKEPSDFISKILDHSFDSIMFYYSIDGKHVSRHVFEKLDYDDAIHSGLYIEDVSFLEHLSDSLQKEYDNRNPSSIIPLKPDEVCNKLLLLSGVEDEYNSTLYYDELYKNKNNIHSLSIDYNDLSSLEEIFYARDLFSHIDMSDYHCIEYNDQYDDERQVYAKFTDNKITEIIALDESSITFITGDSIMVPNKKLHFVKATENGYFLQHGLNENYIVLQWDQWRFGAPYSSDLINTNDIHCITIAPLREKKGKQYLGKAKTITSNEHLGVEHELKKVSDFVYSQAMRKMEKIK